MDRLKGRALINKLSVQRDEGGGGVDGWRRPREGKMETDRKEWSPCFFLTNIMNATKTLEHNSGSNR